MKKQGKGFSTVSIHAGHSRDPLYAHQTPIYATSTFVYDSAEQGMKRFSSQEEGYIYSRWGNPGITEAERKIEAMESYGLNLPVKAILHASGMGAISTLFLSLLRPGDKVLTHYSLYGGTEEYIHKILSELKVEAVIVDFHKHELVKQALSDKAIRLMYIETPANPTMQCVDIAALASMAAAKGVKVACDNTFATPYLQQPFALGADFIVHSTTKFLNGHGTAIGGVLLGKDVEFMSGPVTKFHRLLGGNANPFDTFMLVQGMKTLPLRMNQHCSNASTIAEFLEKHDAVSVVNYPGLASHPDHAVAMKQMKNGGGMISFEIASGLDAGIRFMNKLELCIRTVSLGTVDTLLSHPASMTHYGVDPELRRQYGITDGLIRMNVGVEDVDDIIADLDQALS